jgi:AraC family transcriptional regulator of adaptative response/methylated-DNA-[protein]-cysteine methyltransferase
MQIEGMTPAEYRDGGRALQIRYSFAESPFGHVLVASTGKAYVIWPFMQQKQKGLKCSGKNFPMPK